ncbi:MAG: LCP family protein [Candidatus Moranbacteria bacterium]|nr:LCP family protein [Candidatus Moranbacteria bacterium]MDD3965110.1 LCP family protein [Candidatus Moranbacteria bacterium]
MNPNKHRGWRIFGFFLVLFLIAGGVFAWKTGFVLNKISQGNANIFGSIVKSFPGVEKKLAGEDAGRINILLLGMRGEGVTGGGLLADTIMVLSIHPKQNEQDTTRASLVSIPRDLYVKVPNREEQQKINAVYALGEERALHKGGIEDMSTIVGEVSGLDIPYAMTINFQGFKDLVNAVGGITINLEKPFEEGLQFRGLKKRCDAVKYTVFSGEYEEKRIQRKNGTYYANPKRYPLCFEKISEQAIGELECDGNFKLPAGPNLLDGEKALCYARARETSSDFARAERQQEIINLIKEKALSLGTLTDFSKISAMIDSLGNNASTNMEAWEMKRLFDLYQKAGNTGNINHKVLNTSDEGLLYFPDRNRYPGAGSIILPTGDNYDRIHELFTNLLN